MNETITRIGRNMTVRTREAMVAGYHVKYETHCHNDLNPKQWPPQTHVEVMLGGHWCSLDEPFPGIVPNRADMLHQIREIEREMNEAVGDEAYSSVSAARKKLKAVILEINQKHRRLITGQDNGERAFLRPNMTAGERNIYGPLIDGIESYGWPAALDAIRQAVEQDGTLPAAAARQLLAAIEAARAELTAAAG